MVETIIKQTFAIHPRLKPWAKEIMNLDCQSFKRLAFYLIAIFQNAWFKSWATEMIAP
jgi:hypothetical protein